MNTVQHLVSNSSDTACVVHLLLREGDAGMAPQDPERMMEDIWARATLMGPVMERILHEPHGEPRWGLNE